MSFGDRFGAVGRDVAHLLSSDQPIDAAEVPIATNGHAALLGLLTCLHRDVTGIAPHTVGSTLADLERHPLAVLGHLLARHPRLHEAAPTDVMLMSTATEAGARWKEVGRDSIVALGEWSRSDPALRPRSGDAAWSLLADVSALAGALSELEHDLASGMAHAGAADHADTMHAAATSGLRLAAAHVSDLAGRGPLPDVPALVRVHRLPLAVTGPAAVEAGQHRLVELLGRAQDLRPQDLQRVVALQARCSLICAEALATTDSDLAMGLTDHARALADAISRPGNLASVRPTDPRPLAQAREVHRYLRDADSASVPAAAIGFASTAAPVTRALATTATAQITQGRWLIPTDDRRGAQSPLWMPSSRSAHAPNLLDRLRNVASTAPTQLPAGAPLAPPHKTAQRVLVRDEVVAALAQRLKPTRPAQPAQRMVHRAQLELARAGRRSDCPPSD